MGHSCHLLHLIFIIIFFIISFHYTHTLISVHYTNHNALHKTFRNPDAKRVFLFDKFRVLLGHELKKSRNDFSAAPGPSPSPFDPFPSPSPSPSPSHQHAHAHPLPQAHKVQKKKSRGRGRGARVMTAVLATVGVTAALTAVAMFVGCRRMKKRRRSEGGLSKYIRSHQSSVKKVSSDPGGPDLFYLNSLESALQPQNCCLKHNDAYMDSEITTTTTTTTTTVHEISEFVKHALDQASNSSDQIVDIEHNSDDDDESFHSFCDSHSSQIRLSNASASSAGDEQQVKDVSMASSKIPPPPPPPPPPPLALALPLPKSNKASPLPPPQVPLGKDGFPLPKLKPLHWDKVRAAPNGSTVWDKMRSSSFEFDEEMMESLFGQNCMKKEEAKSKSPSPSNHVLEPKRLHNITILSKALNVSAEQVCGALVRGDGLSLQDLEALSKMVPTKEEEAKLANYKLELGSAEKLVKAMLEIPYAFARIEAMLYRESLEDETNHLKKSFSILEEACKELRSSRLFLKLLEAVLKTGNRMNVGTIRGGAKAFKLDALLKLADVKGTDGKTTLLHFVVREIIRSEGVRVSQSIMGKINQTQIGDKEEIYMRMGLDLVCGLTTELCNAKKTATIDLDVLATSVANLKEGMQNLKNLLIMLEEDNHEQSDSGFLWTMRAFLRHGERKLKEVEEDEDRVLLHVKEITQYFHGDHGHHLTKEDSNPLRIFVIVRDFLSMLDHVCKELRTSPRTPTPFRI